MPEITSRLEGIPRQPNPQRKTSTERDAMSHSTGSVTSTTSSNSSIDDAIAKMKSAFDEAIKTNAEITTKKTHWGSIETVAQQRPNVG
jgi:hypothetical protein